MVNKSAKDRARFPFQMAFSWLINKVADLSPIHFRKQSATDGTKLDLKIGETRVWRIDSGSNLQPLNKWGGDPNHTGYVRPGIPREELILGDAHRLGESSRERLAKSAFGPLSLGVGGGGGGGGLGFIM